MSPPDPTSPSAPWSWEGPALAVLGFAVWALCSVLPSLMQPGAAFRVREAWDTDAFWLYGVPALLGAQALAGAFDRGALWRLPLWTVGGLFAGVLIVRPIGNDFGLLPLAFLFIGVPSFVALLAVSALGRWIAWLLRDLT